MKKVWMAIIPLFIIGMFIFNGVTTYNYPDEYVVLKRFGKVGEVFSESGLHTKNILDEAYKLPKNKMIFDVPVAEINTFDKKRIVVDYYAVWEITNPKQMIETLRTTDKAVFRLNDIIYSGVRTELGKLRFDEIISPDNSARGSIDAKLVGGINEILEQNSNGIRVIDIKMKSVELPHDNEAAVFNRMISERESKAQEYLSQGDAEALKITSNTDKEVAEKLAITEAQAALTIAEGEAEAAQIYNDCYSKDYEFFEFYTFLNSYKKTINKETTIILPSDSNYAKYLVGK